MSSFLPMILILVVFLGLMSWSTRRNMKKQQNQRQELENSMTEGTRVMLTSGLYGTLTHVGDKQAIVELAPGAEVAVVKQAISKVVGPNDEEFSFADDQPGVAADPDQPAVEAPEEQPVLDAGAPDAQAVPDVEAPEGSEYSQRPAEYPSAGEK